MNRNKHNLSREARACSRQGNRGRRDRPVIRQGDVYPVAGVTLHLGSIGADITGLPRRSAGLPARYRLPAQEQVARGSRQDAEDPDHIMGGCRQVDRDGRDVP